MVGPPRLAIYPDERFDLDHDDLDRSQYLGASHVRCNRATVRRRRKPVTKRFSREW
ncbi:MAG: hypothetical protein M3377_10045 [Actinomycetota bacterium]|nr:hypothetical protein [Actinomycetota bacterium]